MTDDGFREMRERRRARAVAEVRSRLIGACGAPPRQLALVLSGALESTPSLRQIEATTKAIMVLAGGPGCGKTVAVVSWLVRAIESCAYAAVDPEGYEKLGKALAPPFFVTAPALARWRRYDADAMDKLLLAPALVIDDLGAEYQDERGSFDTTLEEVSCARHGSFLPTALTTNVPMEAFRARYGKRFIDRIREDGWFWEDTGASMRRAAAT